MTQDRSEISTNCDRRAEGRYALLDFGNGRRLERFGPVTLDRPCPAAEGLDPAIPDAWSRADARFDGRDQEKGQWTDRRDLPERWTVAFGALRFELKRTEFGHLGVFPEQAENWDWIPRVLAGGEGGRATKILNLFAYTGGSTLAAAAAGADVVHVDAAKNVVAWARQNAELSGLADAPIRWIAEDAQKFVGRELKRGNRYDAVILDPPSYGHGPHGETWRLAQHLPRLLSMCAELTAGRLALMLLTCHTPGYDAELLRQIMEECGFSTTSGPCEARPLGIRAADRRILPSGVVVRWRQSPIPNP
jgi:23S rRNA (cytosine1962-C5)-methyltransferase